MAHSVLFDQDQVFNPAAGHNDGLEFYQTQYANPAVPTSETAAAHDDFYAASYGTALPIVERSWLAAFGTTGGFPNEPPLMEELGINFQHIKSKTLA
ncbi:hypothetical protein GGI21_004729, partial [Coemansia aciculifera]